MASASAARVARAPIPQAVPLPPISTRASRYADLMLRAISDELGTMQFVTREDLMQLRIFQHVSTITRYHVVCESVHILLRSARLKAMNRTDLVLPAQASRYKSDEDSVERYADTIWKACRTFRARPFSVMDVVNRWTQDQYLSLNAKRVLVRNGMKRFLKAGRVAMNDEFEYISNEATR